MYEVFDSYLNRDTWHTNHDLDRQRFMQVLAGVVHDDEFNPDEMRKYMLEKKGVRPENRNDSFGLKIDQLTQDAWAVKDFFQMTAR